ncbi:MAG: trypsin-like serine protease, partial [bacterium]
MFKPAKLGLVFALSLILGFQTVGQAQTENQTEKLDKDKSKLSIVLGGKRLGIIAGFVTKERVESLKLGEKRGVLVRDVIKNSSADRAGLKADDVIIEIDGQAIESHRDLRRRLQDLGYGKSSSLKVIRDGNTQQLSFTLEKSSSDNFYAYGYGQNTEEIKKALGQNKEARKKALEESRRAREKYKVEIEKARAEGRERGDLNWHYLSFGRARLGVQTQELTEQLGKYFGLEKGKGALISHVSEDSAGAKAGLLAGDVIIEVNGV